MNSFVIADPSLCIGCRTCEVACAVSHQSGSCTGTLEREGGLHLAIEDGHLVSKDSHFQPRLKVIVGSKVTTPVLCRQCEDKPCAMACPNNAIVSEDTGALRPGTRAVGAGARATAAGRATGRPHPLAG